MKITCMATSAYVQMTDALLKFPEKARNGLKALASATLYVGRKISGSSFAQSIMTMLKNRFCMSAYGQLSLRSFRA